MGLKNKIKHHFHEVLRTKTSDHEIALGFAVGTFLEIFFLLPGLGLIISFLVILLYSRLSKYAIFLALIFWNVLFIAPIYVLSYHVGNFISEIFPAVDFNINIPFYNNAISLGKRFLVGHFLVSFVFSIFIYFIARWVIKTYRQRLDFKQ